MYSTAISSLSSPDSTYIAAWNIESWENLEFLCCCWNCLHRLFRLSANTATLHCPSILVFLLLLFHIEAVLILPTRYLHIDRVQSSVWRLPNYWPPAPPPVRLANVSSPRTNCGGVTHLPGSEEGGGVNILEDARHWTGLLQYNPSTISPNRGAGLEPLPTTVWLLMYLFILSIS